ncbi:methyl-accepting chemotaxis protein [Granulosicoccaceae sp. 1_MG-2023]|nr:methyl-accepting chemotaxis protein [Granulosicoccaceae sp. 1_MG-2023]
MFNFFRKRMMPPVPAQEVVRQAAFVPSLEGLTEALFRFDEIQAPLALAFISPAMDFSATVARIAALAGETPVLACVAVAGLSDQAAADGEGVVLQVFSAKLVAGVDIRGVALHCQDIRAGKSRMSHAQRIGRIAADLQTIRPGFRIDARDTVALTFFDGASKSENYVMEAVYQTGRFPCIFFGGTAGDTAQGQAMPLFDSKNVVAGQAVIAFIKLAPGQRYGVFTSHGRAGRGASFVVVDGDPLQRTVTTVFDEQAHRVVPFIDVLCETLNTSPEGLASTLGDYAFGLEIDGEMFVRAVSAVDPASGAVTFRCDISVGDHLTLMPDAAGAQDVSADIHAYFQDKPAPTAILVHDSTVAAERRAWPAPGAVCHGPGTLFGVQVNRTLSALVFFSDPAFDFRDSLIDNFPVHYACFSGYFARRKLIREERENMQDELQAAFGEVISAAVLGDYSRRVTREFPDSELNLLAQNINSLVSAVDTGLAETGTVLSALAAADLTKRVSGDYQGAFDQLKTNTNGLAERLTQIVSRLSSASNNLKHATGDILSGANDLNDRTTEQSVTNQQASAVVDKLAGTVRENEQHAADARDNTRLVSQTAEDGGMSMGEASDAMARITASSAQISNIIGMIDEIAFQTNLLALNASVEAARVGEAGRGFAVVAVEVRRLSASAAEASTKVKDLIRRSSGEVSDGARCVTEAAGKLSGMLDVVRSNSALMDGIAKASAEQTTAIEEVNLAVRSMDRITQNNAVRVQEIHAAIEQTGAQAAALDDIVRVFRLRGPEPAAGAAATVVPIRSPLSAARPVHGAGQRTAQVPADDEWESF